MELDAEWSFLVSKAPDYFTCFCVPELNSLVKTCAQELSPIVGELDVSDCFGVAVVSPETFSGSDSIPNFAGSIVAR